MVLYPGVETPLANKSPEDINFVVVRENTEGLYAGAGGYIHLEQKMKLQHKNPLIRIMQYIDV